MIHVPRGDEILKKILIINNDPEMCCSLGLFMFIREYYDAVSVTNTEDVERLLPHLPVDLILADVDTPRGNIIKTLMWVKKCFPEIPIVMTYLNLRDHEMEETIFRITDAYILKPLDNEEVMRVIDRKLKKTSRVSRDNGSVRPRA